MHELARVDRRVRNASASSLVNQLHFAYNPQYTPLNPRFSPTAFIRRHDALHVSHLRLAADERYSLGLGMSIDTSGKWWVGSEPADLASYLQALSVNSYKVSEFRLSRCQCSGIRFRLGVQTEEGVAKRVCSDCEAKHFICDSGQYRASGMRLKYFKCVTCKSSVANVGVGFALYDDRSAVHWLYVGERCVECGVLGSMADWKVAYESSLHLLNEA